MFKKTTSSPPKNLVRSSRDIQKRAQQRLEQQTTLERLADRDRDERNSIVQREKAQLQIIGNWFEVKQKEKEDQRKKHQEEKESRNKKFRRFQRDYAWIELIISFLLKVAIIFISFALALKYGQIYDNTSLLFAKIAVVIMPVIGLGTTAIEIFLLLTGKLDVFDDSSDFLTTSNYAVANFFLAVLTAFLWFITGSLTDIWHKPYCFDENGAIYWENRNSTVTVCSIQEGTTDVIIKADYNGLPVSQISDTFLDKAPSVKTLTVCGNPNAPLTFHALSDLEELEQVTFDGSIQFDYGGVAYFGKPHIFKNCQSLSTVTFQNGEFTLPGAYLFLNCGNAQEVRISNATLTGKQIIGQERYTYLNFYGANGAEDHRIDLTVTNSTVDAITADIQTLTLNGACEFSALSKDRDANIQLCIADTLVVGSDFDFEKELSHIYNASYWGMDYHYTATAPAIYLPVTATKIPNGLLGNEDVCIVYYQGSEEQWNSLPVGDNNQALADGKVSVIFFASHESWE